MKYEGMKFCEALTKCRKTSKEYNTQEKLAAKTLISKRDIGRFERGEVRPSVAEIKTICDVLGCPELGDMLEAEKEYERTHPEVKICFSDNTHCWRCGEKMKTVYGLIDGCPITPDDFNESMLAISRAKGVILEERESGTTGETHMVNICPHCGTFLGDFYVHELWYGETEIIPVDDIKDFIVPKEEFEKWQR